MSKIRFLSSILFEGMLHNIHERFVPDMSCLSIFLRTSHQINLVAVLAENPILGNKVTFFSEYIFSYVLIG